MKHLAMGFALVLTLAACAQTRWDRADTGPDTARADLAQCRRSAQQEAFRQTADPYMAPPFGLYGPYDGFLWRPGYQQWQADQRFALQNRLTDYCMKTKGYQRVAVQPS